MNKNEYNDLENQTFGTYSDKQRLSAFKAKSKNQQN